MIKNKLFADPSFWLATPEQRNLECNGCGPKLYGVGDYLVPDFLLGINIKAACDIHDWMYKFCTPFSIETKDYCDRVFLNNMQRIIDNDMQCPPPRAEHWYNFIDKAKRWKWFRLHDARYKMAELYYVAVNKFGGPAYWKNKNKLDEMGIA